MKKAKKIKMVLFMMAAISCQSAVQMAPVYADTTVASRLSSVAQTIVEQAQGLTCIVDGQELPDFLIPNC